MLRLLVKCTVLHVHIVKIDHFSNTVMYVVATIIVVHMRLYILLYLRVCQSRFMGVAPARAV